MNYRLTKTRRFYRTTAHLRLESLEPRLPLHGEACLVSNCAPDLHMDDVSLQSTRVNEEIVVDLYAAGAVVTDVDDEDVATGDAIRLQLDPDDGPSNATLTSDGIFRWTPTVDQIGTFEFVIIAIDEGPPPLADAEILTVEVRPNEAPELSSVADLTLAVNEQLEVNLLANDSDGDNLTFALDPEQQSPEGITIEQLDSNNAVLRWTPGAADAGTSPNVSLLVIDDGFPPMSDKEVFNISIMSVAAIDDAYTTAPNAVLSVDFADGVLANDLDSDGDPITVSVVDQPANGILTLSDDGSFEYEPTATFQGTDQFTYEASDGTGDTSVARVTITVNSSPVVIDDMFTGIEDTTLTIDADSGVLANDSDVDGDTLTATTVQPPNNGALTLDEDGSFEFIPADEFGGTVSFTYLVSDGLTSIEATATIEIIAVNDAPVAESESYSVDEDQQLAINNDIGLLANDSDADSNNLTVDLSDAPANGIVDVDFDGSFVYSPNQDFSGTDSFRYTVTDGENTSSVATATIEVLPVNDAPIGTADNYAATEGVLSIDGVTGVLANDADADGDEITAQLINTTTNGSLTFNSDGSFAYTSDVGFSGEDSFSYLVNDGQASSATVAVTISVSNINDAPVGQADEYIGTEDEILIVEAAFGVLANDTDADGDTLTAILTDEPAQGSLVLNADGSFEYTPNQDSSGLDDFSYQVNDGVATSAEILVSIAVAPVNDAPSVQADSFEVDMNELLSIVASEGVLQNDSDVEGDSLTATVVDEPNDGSLSLSSDGSFNYEPDTNFSGTDTFSYRASDGNDESDVAVVSITVNATEFGQVEIGSFADASLSGIRTDLEPGALPISANHVTTAVDYTGYSNPPTYGPHHGFLLDSDGSSITPRPTGVYETEQPDEDLVHNLEHGHVWISYNPNLIDAEELSALEQLVIDGGTDTGVILTPRAANTDKIALASWSRLLTLDSFDSAQIRTFIETNRGKASEGFIPSGQKLNNADSEALTDGLPH